MIANFKVPLPIYFKVTDILFLITLFGFFFFIPALVVSSLRLGIRVFLFLIFIPSCLFFILLFIVSGESIVNSVDTGKRHIHLVEGFKILDNKTDYYLYDCNSSDLECTLELVDEGGVGPYTTELIVDDNSNNVHVFRDGYLQFTYGTTPHWYYLYDIWEIGDHTYKVALYYNEKYYNEKTEGFIIYRYRSGTTVDSEILPFRYEVSEYKDIELKDAEGNGEISVYVDGQLIYIYGTSPLCFTEKCSYNQ